MALHITKQTDALNFYGHGKLLITGEYFVLDGAEALAVPVKFGQKLRLTELKSSEGLLYWVALNNQKKAWLNLVFDTANFSCLNSKQAEAQRLSAILKSARALNPSFLNNQKDIAVETQLEFPNEWGFGSSSTLIHCISQWAGVDGYDLLKQTIGGSGYDLACAEANSAILYNLQNGVPNSIALKWNPSFKNQLYFVYTGKKQLSSEAIAHYKALPGDKSHAIHQLNRITESMLKCQNIEEFEYLVKEHENLVGSELKMMKVADTTFSDYWGSIKSLGAWGGDFVMMTNDRGETALKDYLREKNISIVFSWDELILGN